MSNEGRTKVPPAEETGNVLQFIWKHKNKILIGGAICAAGYAAYQHYFPVPPKLQEDEEEEKRIATVNNMTSGHRDLLKPGQRSRMLLRIRKQFDIAIKQFLPTVRLKIATAVDVSSAIRQIKELRCIKNNNENGGSMKNGQHIASMNEALLWEEVKVSSLTLLYLSAYMVSAVTVLLRVQLHILGKSIHVMKPDGLSSGMKDGGGSMMGANVASDSGGINGNHGNGNSATTDHATTTAAAGCNPNQTLS